MTKSALWQLFIEYGLPLLLSTVLPALLALGTRALKAWTDGLVAKNEGAKGYLVLQRVSYFASTVVVDIEQTLRPHIKTAMADGKLSKEEGQYLKGIAVERLKKIMGEEGVKELKAVLGIFDVDVFLSGLIEKLVGAESAPPPAATAVAALAAAPAAVPSPA